MELPTARATDSHVPSRPRGWAAMTSDLIAFLDESRKPVRNPATGRVHRPGRSHYVVSAAVVIDGDAPDIRRQLGRVEGGIGYRLHYRNLTPSRRTETLEAIDGIDGWDGYLFETARALPDTHYNEHHVRAKVVEEAFTYLSAEGVVEAVLETRAGSKQDFQALDDNDRRVWRRLKRQGTVPKNFRIRHDDKTEAILQIADLLAGARSDWLCGVNRDPYARVTHRVRSIRTVFKNMS